MDKIGLYIHIPFCDGKCPYCDFYSISAGEELKELYTAALLREMDLYAADGVKCDTLYIGGGTPLELGAERLCRVINRGVALFGAPNELTVEINPSAQLHKAVNQLAACGVNRISIGMQSANDDELLALGRKHTSAQTAQAVDWVRCAGIENISLDIMLGIPLQTSESLRRTVEIAAHLEVAHISAYMLKLEQGTPFYARRETLGAADEDTMSDFYEQLCRHMRQLGYGHYEISNFARDGFESKHNLKYWRCQEYIGLGCGAHSFYKGRRFCYPRDIHGYISNPQRVDEGAGGGFEEYVMLGLRLGEGISLAKCARFCGGRLLPRFENTVGLLCAGGLAKRDGERLSLTEKGFLLSNSIIARLLQE